MVGMDKRLILVSKYLAKHLRHAPGEWVAVDNLLAAAGKDGFPITYDEPVECVETNDQRRYSFDEPGNKLRANQGHSVEVDLQLEERQPPDVLYYGTVDRFLPSILSEGLNKGKRRHVHLSKDVETARKVGSRRAGGPHGRIRADAQGRARFLPVGQRGVADGRRAARIPDEVEIDSTRLTGRCRASINDLGLFRVSDRTSTDESGRPPLR